MTTVALRVRSVLVLGLALIVGVGGLAAEAASARWTPAVGLTWDIQLSRTPSAFADLDAYDVDLSDTPESTIAAMHAAGIAVICYFSAGSYENWRDDANELAPYRGRKLGNWPGEWWIDIRRSEVRQVMETRLDEARYKGCDAVDPDNVDGYANRNGLGLTEADQLDYLGFLATEAHERGLAIGLKNAVELVPDVVDDYDFAVNEECFDYRECDALQQFIANGKPVLQIQYGGRKQARRICPRANALGFSTLVKTMALDERGISCRT